jgi:hypothetical protein
MMYSYYYIFSKLVHPLHCTHEAKLELLFPTQTVTYEHENRSFVGYF